VDRRTARTRGLEVTVSCRNPADCKPARCVHWCDTPLIVTEQQRGLRKAPAYGGTKARFGRTAFTDVQNKVNRIQARYF
jgi:hypothetical protein